MNRNARRLTARLSTLAAATLAAATLAVTGLQAPASATPTTGAQGLACGGGGIMTAPPGGTATQNYRGSTSPDAVWWVGLYHLGAGGWEFSWQQGFTAAVATNDAFPGSMTGFLSAWTPMNRATGPVSYALMRGIPGHTYAVLNYVADSEGARWSYSMLGNGSNVCRA